MGGELALEGPGDGSRTLASGDAEPERRRGAVERKRVAAQSRHDHREQRPGGRLDGAPCRTTGQLRCEWKQRQGSHGAEERARDEREVAAGIGPGEGHPRNSQDAEENREPERDVPEREEADAEGERQRRAR
jgi:hypothetical protein